MTAASDKLAQTRLAILQHVQRKERRREVAREELHEAKDEAKAHARAAMSGGAPGAAGRARRAAEGWVGHAQEAFESWWRYHPAHMAVDLARPVLSGYARRKPVQFLGIAAAAGALLFFARPWKLISVTGVMVALLKSPQMASLIMSAMSASQNPRDDEPVTDD